MAEMTRAGKIGLAAGGVVLLGGAAAVLALGQFFDLPQAASQLDKAVVDAQVIGIPMTSAELVEDGPGAVRTHLTPDGQRLLAQFETKQPLDLVSKHFDKIVSSKEPWSAARHDLEEHQDAVASLRRMATQEGLTFDVDYDMFPYATFPEFAQVKGAARFLLADALVKSNENDFETAAQDIRAARQLGQVVARTPVLISLLVQIAIEALAARATESCLALATRSESGLKAFETVALSPEPAFDLRRALRGEAFMGVTLTRNFNRMGGLKGLQSMSSGEPGPAPQPASLLRSGVPSGLIERGFMARVLQYWIQAFKVMDEHPGDPVAVSTGLDRLAQDATKSKSASNTIVAVLLPVFAQAGQAEVTGTATFRCKLALAKILRWRLAHHRFPKDLVEAGVELKDPFSGRPLRYRASGDSVRVWSVGPNLVDDGGIARSEVTGRQTDDWDIVGAYPPVTSKK